VAPQAPAPPASVHRYGASRPWAVGLLAALAAGGAVLVTGSLSTVFTAATVAEAQPGGVRAPEPVARNASAVAVAPVAAAAPGTSAARAWQIQIGAFRNPAAAEDQLRAAASLVPGLAGLPQAAHALGEVTRARFGGIADEDSARTLCTRLVDAGGSCFVVAPGS